jgi:hypothetical protein
MVTGHPNTIAALIAGGLGSLTAYLLAKYAGVHLTPAQSGGIATGYAAVLLFIGRRGLKGTIQAVWNGVWNGVPKQAARPVEPPAEQ